MKTALHDTGTWVFTFNQKNPKKMWDILKEHSTGKKGHEKIEKIQNNRGIFTDNRAIANEFNRFFASAGNNISNSVGLTDRSPESFMPDADPPPLELTAISQAEFINIINSLQPKQSFDIDGVNNKLIKFLKFEIAGPLVHIFNLSLAQGIFPAKLKTSKTVPIFKAGDKTLCDNYRPISLLSSISKILEKAVANRLTRHLKDNDLLCHEQFGFQEGTSTVHHLLKLTNYISNELNDKKYVVGVFLDLRKAFDVVAHDILLRKLKKLGVNDSALKWFQSYLEGRQQRVEINGALSDIELITISILQGSILGPLLFLCFINDLPRCINLFTLLFADDTASLSSGPELKPLLKSVNDELKKLAQWFRANRMAVNVGKTKYIIFKSRGKTIRLNDDEGVYYDDNDSNDVYDPSKVTKLIRVYNDNPNTDDRSYKLLGIYLDEHLSFDTHCTHVCNKISQSNYIINRSKHFLPTKSLKTLYFALVHSHLLYCLPIYSCTSQKNLTKLFKAQKKAIRAICNANYNAHTTPLFINLGIMPLNHLIRYTQGLLTHSIVHKYSPLSLHNTWITNMDRNPDRILRDADELYIPIANSDQTKKLPFFALAVNWNRLPYDKFHANPTTFRIALNNHIWETINTE
jgi:Reverse transcriptase (RNA-dependent DNA polymerase)